LIKANKVMAFKTTDTQQSTNLNWFKWLLVAILFVAGIVANYYYSAQPWPLRLLGWLLLVAVMAAIASQTYQGKAALTFARESRMELRKVFWPTRQETMQTTLFVAAMVVILALILWVIDSGLMWAIGWLTGQRG
jgi:preprotein translocase subunit SecE